MAEHVGLLACPEAPAGQADPRNVEDAGRPVALRNAREGPEPFEGHLRAHVRLAAGTTEAGGGGRQARPSAALGCLGEVGGHRDEAGPEPGVVAAAVPEQHVHDGVVVAQQGVPRRHGPAARRAAGREPPVGLLVVEHLVQHAVDARVVAGAQAAVRQEREQVRGVVRVVVAGERAAGVPRVQPVEQVAGGRVDEHGPAGVAHLRIVVGPVKDAGQQGPARRRVVVGCHPFARVGKQVSPDPRRHRDHGTTLLLDGPPAPAVHTELLRIGPWHGRHPSSEGSRPHRSPLLVTVSLPRGHCSRPGPLTRGPDPWVQVRPPGRLPTGMSRTDRKPSSGERQPGILSCRNAGRLSS